MTADVKFLAKAVKQQISELVEKDFEIGTDLLENLKDPSLLLMLTCCDLPACFSEQFQTCPEHPVDLLLLRRFSSERG